LHIQVFLLNEPHLSLMELIFTAVKNALNNTLIPELLCSYNEITNIETVDLSGKSYSLEFSSLDDLLVVGIIEGIYVTDMTEQ
jgi:hypothetical protein